jgi:hypothetical protein
MNYIILYAGNPGSLTEFVNNHIKEGWTPLGGVSVSETAYSYENAREGCTETAQDSTWAQAMVKND